MTCSSSLADDLTPLVLDTSVLINLHACTYGRKILSAIPNDIFVASLVTRELDHETSHSNGDTSFMRELISQRIVTTMQLDKNSYQVYETLTQNPHSLDDGEAATISIASSLGFIPVIDERKGRTQAKGLMNNKASAWSLDLFTHPNVQEGLPNKGYIEAIFLALREGRMRIDEEHCDAVVRLISIERALHCTSLPNYKSRKENWLRTLEARTTPPSYRTHPPLY